MENDQNDQNRVCQWIRMEYQRPIRFLLLCHQEKGCQKLYPQEDNEQKTRDPMKYPDKHIVLSFYCGGYIKLKSFQIVKDNPNAKLDFNLNCCVLKKFDSLRKLHMAI
jgi:hypothetical protein